MSIKNYPKNMQGMVARDELLDVIDMLASKISQCREVGMTDDEIQLEIRSYHDCHINYPLIRVL